MHETQRNCEILGAGSEVEKVATGPILDVNDPNVGVEGDLALQTDANRRRIQPVFGVHPRPQTLHAIVADFTLRRRTEQSLLSIQTVDDDKDGAGFLGTTTTQGGISPFDRTTAQIGRHPYASLEPHDQLI